MFESLGEEVETVDVEGWKATALRSTLDAMAQVTVEHECALAAHV